MARDPNTSFRRQQISAFENPGYEGTRAMGVGGKEDYTEVEAGNFSIYEEIKESGAVTQSAVTEICMAPVLVTENSNVEEGIGESHHTDKATFDCHLNPCFTNCVARRADFLHRRNTGLQIAS